MAADFMCGSGAGWLSGWAPRRGTLTLSPHQPHPLREKALCWKAQPILVVNKKWLQLQRLKVQPLDINCMLYVLTDLVQQGCYWETERGEDMERVWRGKEPDWEIEWGTQREGRKERKTIRRQMCARTDMLLLASRSHCDSYGRVGSWLGKRWKH